MAAPKEAIVLVIDTSPTMSSAAPGQKSLLETSVAAVNMICQRKLFSNSKDEVALVLLGTEEANNSLNEENGGYEHITVARELALPDLNLLKFITKDVSPGSAEADFVDGIVVALDHLMRKNVGRKYETRIVLFTDLSSPFDADQIETIVSTMKTHKVQFTFVGPEVEDDDKNLQHDNGDDADNADEGGPSAAPPCNRRHPATKTLTQQQLTGIGCVRHILDELDGQGIEMSELLPMLSFFQARLIKQTTVFRGQLEIGASVKINVYGYLKMKEARPSAWSKLSALSEASANPGTMKVLLQRSYHLNDEDQTEVDKETEAKAYRYGNTLVPVSKMDQESIKLETTKCLSLLGFTSSANVRRHQCIGDAVYLFVPQPDDENAAIALSSLVHALQEKDMVAVVRYCFRKNASPKIGFLTPYIKNEYEGLMFIQLPFREDLRQYTFASLDANADAQPSGAQLDAVDLLIDSMDLTQTPAQAERVESKSTKVMNPAIQRQCQYIQHRALNPEDENLPPVDEAVQRSIQTTGALSNQALDQLHRLQGLFELKPVEKKSSKNVNVFNKSAGDGPVAKRKKDEDEDESVAGGGILTLSDIARQEVTEIGTVDPLGDFEILLKRSDGSRQRDLCLRLQSRIIELVTSSFLDQYYDKALRTAKAFRDHCIKLNHPAVFNELLEKVKETMKGQRHHDFWLLMMTSAVYPIMSTECAASAFTKEDAQSFYEEVKEEEDDVPLETQPVEDVDDLVAMM